MGFLANIIPRNKKGQRHGLVTMHYKLRSGSILKCEGTFVNDKREGEYITYRDNKIRFHDCLRHGKNFGEQLDYPI